MIGRSALSSSAPAQPGGALVNLIELAAPGLVKLIDIVSTPGGGLVRLVRLIDTVSTLGGCAVIAPKAEPPLMSPEQAAKVLDRVIYEQVAACIDFELLYTTEQELCFALFDVGVDTDDVEALAAQLIDTALDQVKRDVRRTIDVRSSPLAGMDCELCEDEARQQHPPAR